MPKPKILVIEDERALVEVLAYNLEREGFEVLVAHDGQDGLRQAQFKLPDLIVLDLMLPLKGGPGGLPRAAAGARGPARSRSSWSRPRPRRPTSSSASPPGPTTT